MFLLQALDVVQYHGDLVYDLDQVLAYWEHRLIHEPSYRFRQPGYKQPLKSG